VRDETPHLTLALAHEGPEGQAIAVAGRNGQPREIVHRRATILGNLEPPGVDSLPMDCKWIRVVMSAPLDAVDPGISAERQGPA